MSILALALALCGRGGSDISAAAVERARFKELLRRARDIDGTRETNGATAPLRVTVRKRAPGSVDSGLRVQGDVELVGQQAARWTENGSANRLDASP